MKTKSKQVWQIVQKKINSKKKRKRKTHIKIQKLTEFQNLFRLILRDLQPKQLSITKSKTLS